LISDLWIGQKAICSWWLHDPIWALTEPLARSIKSWIMPADSQKLYPGELASPGEIRLLADEYRKAARLLQQLGRAGEPLSRAPFRLSAIHAIELYLNAFLLHRGYAPSEIRRMHHNLAERTDLAIVGGLRLRSRTTAHLHTLAANREYLVTRYGPELSGTASQINRLEATLAEVSRKVTETLTARRPISANQD
jgi:hypothetical protein